MKFKNRILLVVIICCGVFFLEPFPIIRSQSTQSNSSIEIQEIIEISGSNPYDIQVLDDIAYILDFSSGFKTYDISDPSSPEELDTYAPINYYDPNVKGGHTFCIRGEYAIVAFIHSGIQILNISDPNNIQKVSAIDNGGEYYHSYVKDNLVYCAKAENGLEIIDISNPQVLTQKGSFSNGNPFYYIYVHDNIAFTNDDSQNKMLYLNISDAQNPTEIMTLDIIFTQMVVVDDVAFITLETGGVKIYNFSDPFDPVLLNHYNPGGPMVDIEIQGDLAYLANGAFGLKIINITDPSNPVLVGEYNDGGVSTNLCLANNMVFIAENDGWEILQFKGEDSRTIKGSLPIMIFFCFGTIFYLLKRKKIN